MNTEPNARQSPAFTSHVAMADRSAKLRADPLGTDYRNRLAAEKRFYEDRDTVHDLPDIFHYWSETHIRPKLEAVGFRDSLDMVSQTLAKRSALRPHQLQRYVSIGSGNCDFEIDIASRLRAAGHSSFVIDCLDLNPVMLERGRSSAARQGLSEHIHTVEADFNEWHPEPEYDGAIAIQSLHHVVNLEGLFSGIKASLNRGGRFVISDMIGRNGHQRWPEALAIVQEFWRDLPPSYRYNRQLKRFEERFEDWDCSLDGFEGIRSQDILPLLIENFHFQTFVAYGNVIDPFVDRHFGHHFDPASKWDRDLIDRIHARDELEIAAGRIKPTHMFAIAATSDDEPSVFADGLSPAFCVRWPNAPALAGSFRGAVQEDRQPGIETAMVSSPEDVSREGRALSYADRTWPHSTTRELEIACQRLRDSQADARVLRQQVTGLNQQLSHLNDELEERTEWALLLEKEVEERTLWAMGLEKEGEERISWTLQFDRELKDRTDWALALEEQLKERTNWALLLERELNEIKAVLERQASSSKLRRLVRAVPGVGWLTRRLLS